VDKNQGIDDSEKEDALFQLVMNCPEMLVLQSRLSTFNIFKALRADQNELRHSNMIAWLVNPEEAHGFDDLFLRRLLMHVFQQVTAAECRPAGWVSPIVVDVLDVDRIEVHRELDSIDLLFTIYLRGGNTWTICIENKVNSRQGVNQLQRYFDLVERRYANSERRIYVFLTRNSESPAHNEFVPITYSHVSEVLAHCLSQRTGSIGDGPQLLVQHYHQLLSEDFVEDSETAQLARQIYFKHRVALDFIFDNKPDQISEVTNAVETKLKRRAQDMGIVLGHSGKGYVRFLPSAWDVPCNSGGAAWGSNSRYLVIELNLWTKYVELHVTSGKAPEDFADRLWQRMASAPFKQEWKKRPQQFIKPYKSKSNIPVKDVGDLVPSDVADNIVEWLETELKLPQFCEVVKVLEHLLFELSEH
jgi:hypothetical protein